MIQVLISNQFKYPLSESKIKKEVTEFLRSHDVNETSVSIAIVNEETMLGVSNTHLKDNAVHDVLSFPENEVSGKFVSPPGATSSLGDIIVCYEMAEEEAKEENMPTEQKVIELMLHGTLHLMGVHHD